MNTQSVRIELIIGTLWLSRYELSALKPGMIIRTTRIAGTGFELHMGGRNIADIDLTPIDLPAGNSSLCARIRSFTSLAYPEPEPCRGATLFEMLPCSISVGSFSTTVQKIESLTPMSLIDASIDATPDQQCTLIMAGMPVARGIVYVIGEHMGMRVTEVVESIPGTIPFRTSGNLLNEIWSAGKTVPYDFKRPDWFTRTQLKRIEHIHHDFLGALVAMPDTTLSAGTIELVDQLNFTEFLDMASPDATVYAVPAAAARPGRIGEADDQLPPKIVHIKDSPGFPDEEVQRWIETERERPSRSGSILVCGSAFSTHADAITTALRDAWKNYGSISPRSSHEIGTVDDSRWKKERQSPVLSEYAGEYEMIVLVRCVFSPGDILWIVYPMRTLSSVLKALSL